MFQHFYDLFHPQDLRDWLDLIIYVIACLFCGFTAVQLYNYHKYGGYKLKKRIPKVVAIACALLLIAALFHTGNLERHDLIKIYNEALEYEENGDYDKAYYKFAELVNHNGTFRDSKKHMNDTYIRYQYMYGKRYMELGSYDVAYEYFHNAGDYMNAKFFADYCYFTYLKNKHPEWLYDKSLT